MLFKIHSVTVITEKKKFDGSTVVVAECLAGDASGVVILIARNGKRVLANLR